MYCYIFRNKENETGNEAVAFKFNPSMFLEVHPMGFIHLNFSNKLFISGILKHFMNFRKLWLKNGKISTLIYQEKTFYLGNQNVI